MFKRLFIKSLVLLVIFVGGGYYIAYTKGLDVTALTSKLFQFARLGNLDLETLRIDSERVEDNVRVLQAGKQRVYKWQDQSGQWHYTQIRPPADARAIESMDLDPMQNVIVGLRPPQAVDEPPEEEPIKRAEPEPEPEPEEITAENPYSPEAIKKLFEDAKGLQEALSKRYETQEQLLQGQ
ncbi:MAG: DUF4124 domain-containing protein [Gammaproteobacteria bacterium]|nr:DUF4124 domain-containing protein [Gammaproteobacteria bacterium]